MITQNRTQYMKQICNMEELYQPFALVGNLSYLLAERKQGFLAESAGYTLKELIGNAVKASAKRIWFMDNGLDMDNPEDYQRGMPSFRSAYFEEKSRSNLEKLCRLNKRCITVEFRHENDTLVISVENQGILTPEEKDRITQRLEFSARPVDAQEIMSEVLDETEGAGLGLLLSIKMLNKNGVPGKPVQFSDAEGLTRFEIMIPDWITPPTDLGETAAEIAEQINYLPPLPASITELMSRLESENCNFACLEKYLKTDPGLSANILRCANSPLYMNKQSISSLETAVKTIGFQGVQKILYFTGAFNALSGKLPSAEVQEFTRHSYRVATVASHLAKSSPQGIDPMEAFTIGLLHDLGKLVLLSRKISPSDEIIYEGLEHDKVGFRLSQHWNFPEIIQLSIKHHHHPGNSPVRSRAMAEIIYLADRISYIDENRIFPGEINPEILYKWGMTTPEAQGEFITKELAVLSDLNDSAFI